MTKKNRIEIDCFECGKKLYRIPSRIKKTKRQFCDAKCQGIWQSKYRVKENSPTYKGGPIDYPCDYCGKVVKKHRCTVKRSNYLFCSIKCNALWKSEHMSGENSPAYKGHTKIVHCYICGCDVERELNQLKRNDKNFCGRECWAEWRRSDEWRGENNPTYKPELGDEERKWRTHTEPTYNTWMKRVRERDNYKCQICKYVGRGGDIVVHHLNSWNLFPDERVNLDNGICLCFDCHDEFHGVYGKGDNTEEQFIEFCQSKDVQLEHEHCRLSIS